MSAKKQPTADEWRQIDQCLRSLFSEVVLRIDGYEVTLGLSQVSQFENAITVYVNGWLKGAWLVEKTEEARRFFPLRMRAANTTRFREEFVKAFGKRAAQKHGLFSKVGYYGAYWKSFRSLKRHLIANNDSIEIVKLPKPVAQEYES